MTRPSPGLLLLVLATACGGGSGGPDGGEPIDATPAADAPVDAYIPEDIAEYLATVPGLTFTEETTDQPGYRRFLITLEQPLDHDTPEGRTFGQRMVLHHADRAAPMILYTSGYMLFGDDYLSELGGMLGANQVSTEQRFFDQSIPQPLQAGDWSHVTIAQAAHDHHRVVEALAPYYRAPWVSTGHSKGGMTSIYHRRFHPGDVDATVAYVAPISFGAPDYRYSSFFDAVGPTGCEQGLEALQREALTRFSAMLTRAEQEASAWGYQYTRWEGGLPAALEDSIVGLTWSFWQYAGGASCGDVPGTSATDSQIYSFVSAYGGIGTPDSTLESLQTYFFQAATQLGFPGTDSSYLSDLLQYQNASVQMPPDGAETTYDAGAAMQDVANWVSAQGSELMFVYGQWDPWYAGAFDPGNATDSHFFVVPGANHGALIGDLDPADRTLALEVIERWTGVQPMAAALLRARPPELPAASTRARLRIP